MFICHEISFFKSETKEAICKSIMRDQLEGLKIVNQRMILKSEKFNPRGFQNNCNYCCNYVIGIMHQGKIYIHTCNYIYVCIYMYTYLCNIIILCLFIIMLKQVLVRYYTYSFFLTAQFRSQCFNFYFTNEYGSHVF